MRILLVPLVFGLLLAGCVTREAMTPPSPSPPLPPQTVHNETWYLFESTDEAEFQLVPEVPPGSLHFYPWQVGATGTDWFPARGFVATTTSAGFAAPCGQAIVWFGEDAPHDGSVSVEVLVEGEAVASGESRYSYPPLGGLPVWTAMEVVVPLQFHAEIPSNSTLTLRSGFEAPRGLTIGYGDEWPSRLELRDGTCAA